MPPEYQPIRLDTPKYVEGRWIDEVSEERRLLTQEEYDKADREGKSNDAAQQKLQDFCSELNEGVQVRNELRRRGELDGEMEGEYFVPRDENDLKIFANRTKSDHMCITSKWVSDRGDSGWMYFKLHDPSYYHEGRGWKTNDNRSEYCGRCVRLRTVPQTIEIIQGMSNQILVMRITK